MKIHISPNGKKTKPKNLRLVWTLQYWNSRWKTSEGGTMCSQITAWLQPPANSGNFMSYNSRLSFPKCSQFSRISTSRARNGRSWKTTQGCIHFFPNKDQWSIARSMVSANHWLKSMENCTFLWKLTLVSGNNNNNAVLGHYTMSQCPYKFTDIEK